jgi:hypothetical protein
MALPVGNYIAIARSATDGALDNDAQTPFVEIAFEVIEGEQKGQTMTQRFFLTDAALKYTTANLQNCGCPEPWNSYAGIGTKRVEIVVQKQKPKAGQAESKYVEIRFVNDPDRAPKVAKPVEQDRLAAIRQKMKAAADQAKAAASPTPTTGKAPF